MFSLIWVNVAPPPFCLPPPPPTLGLFFRLQPLQDPPSPFVPPPPPPNHQLFLLIPSCCCTVHTYRKKPFPQKAAYGGKQSTYRLPSFLSSSLHLIHIAHTPSRIHTYYSRCSRSQSLNLALSSRHHSSLCMLQDCWCAGTLYMYVHNVQDKKVDSIYTVLLGVV